MTTQNARPRRPSPRQAADTGTASPHLRHVAVVGAGMAGIACARTLVQAGCHVTLIEKSRGFGGRMAPEGPSSVDSTTGPSTSPRGTAALRVCC